MTTILLIDLSSIAHPLWHTTQGSSNPNECSIQTVAKVRALASGQPHVAVCCDSGRSFRRDVSPDYKANRPESDATLQHQITLAREMLVADGFPVWAVKGFEADDLLATATRLAGMRSCNLDGTDERAPSDVIIASSDKDMFQLVSDRVSVHRVAATQKATTVTPEVVRAEYGIDPNQMTEWLMLVGDKSDNILGAPGIGEVTATKLLATFGNLADTYAALDTKKAPFTEKTAKGLADLRPRLDTVRQLVTLRTDVPLPFEEVFRERVPADVAVFGGEDMDEHAMKAHAAGVATAAADAVGMGSEDRAALRSVGVPVAEQAPRLDAHSVAHDIREMHAKAEAEYKKVQADTQPQSLAVRDVEVLPPPSMRFEEQLEPRSFSQALQMGSILHKARLFNGYGSAEAVTSTILIARELGMPAGAGLRGFHIAEGRHLMHADLIRARVLMYEKCEYFRCTERTNERATFITKRKGDPEMSLTFTMEDAKLAWSKEAGAFVKSGWGHNPADMLVARASSKLARLVYPEQVHGFYAPEEME